MPRHELRMRQTARIVGETDVVFDIRSDGLKLGEVHISQGGIDWWPRNSKVHYHRLTWEQFSGLLEERPKRRSNPKAAGA